MEEKKRGSEDAFQRILIEHVTTSKAYENGKIKWHQYASAIDALFSQYGWSKSAFFEEIDKRKGVLK